jgi:H+/Cl- antiporter ClcA
VLPALLMSLTSTVVAWIFIGHGVLYHVAADHFRASQLAFAVIMGPIVGLVATGWTRVISRLSRRKPRGAWKWLAPPLAFAALGLLSLHYPQLLGNGRGIVQLAIVGNLSLGLLVMLLILKPLVTSFCLASGAPGGLFTPTLAFGVLLAGAFGSIWAHIWPGSAPSVYALIGGGAFLAAAMQSPLAGVVLILELTGQIESLVVPTLIAVVVATALSRRLGAQSIYSARLPSGLSFEGSPTANAASIATINAMDGATALEMAQRPEPPS